MTAWDRTAIILLGAAGFAFSYDALRQIAIAIHARETLSYLFPVFIDGFIAYGVRAIVLLRHRPFGARLYAWFLFLAATGASLGANALHAITLNHGPQAGRSALHLTDSVVGVLSTLAPLALAGSVHLYILMARTAELSVRDGADNGPGPVRQDVPPLDSSAVAPEPRPLEVTTTTGMPSIAARPSAADSAAGAVVDLRKHGTVQSGESPSNDPSACPSAAADRTEEERDKADGLPAVLADSGAATPPPTTAGSSVPETVRARADGEESPVPDDADFPQDREAGDEWLEDLLPIARAASEQAGRISRDAVKEAVRAQQPISNDRLGVLLVRLKEEEDEAAKVPAGSSSALW
ncbi:MULTISPECIES: DUF2637 domain-containing protein [unclassified Streptomyces]|uniref:DUF2637 domain-containing protein n=1 Tax=unclassified Streptomyces TaxID=2593676 RepID=UPI001BE61F5E|nr:MULTISPECIES: DUF2637 domain-containing protein [unclassified Streptomyces]MBT2405569.1 DUF2637 domain-containing protein [Streptomyces sp. ISL-21]MBT2607751.1 DUF2637 domain-containing protein [Streptomyces sp. ISL-87]